MADELEIKFKLDRPDDLRRRLGLAGGICRGTVFEQNQLFDFADGRLWAAHSGLRVRVTAGGGPVAVTLTFKRPLAAAADLKHMAEHETRVEDHLGLLAILGGLGLRPVLSYEKRRETWTLADCTVTLDELPQLGWYVEIEAELESQIRWACRELQLDGVAVRENYPALTAKHGRRDEQGGVDLRF